MAIIVTYDIPSKQIELKKLLFSKGYTDKIQHFQEGVYKNIYLPNTTVYHATKTPSEGRGDLQSCTTTLQVKLERCISTPWGPNWAAIYGEPFQ